MGLIGGLKIAGILGIILALGYGVNWVYGKHLDAINNAVNVAMLEAGAARQEAVNNATDKLREENKIEREALQAELRKSRAKVSDLQRMLLIDHDLDRLLQEKPGLIVPRVNKGTEAVLKELEELTQ